MEDVDTPTAIKGVEAPTGTVEVPANPARGGIARPRRVWVPTSPTDQVVSGAGLGELLMRSHMLYLQQNIVAVLRSRFDVFTLCGVVHASMLSLLSICYVSDGAPRVWLPTPHPEPPRLGAAADIDRNQRFCCDAH